MIKSSIHILLFLISFSCFAQLDNSLYSIPTIKVVKQLDSLIKAEMANDKKGLEIESKYLDDRKQKSTRFELYTKLLYTAKEKELLSLVKDSSLLTTVRAYAYMAYAYQIDSLQIKEEAIKCNFPVDLQIGCVIQATKDFQEFKSKARKRKLYNP